VAQRFLPQPLYRRLDESPIAKRLARGSLWSLVGSAVSRILVLVAMILAARMLGQISFGEFALIQSTLGVFGIMAGVGLGSAATRFVAQYAKTDPARAGRVIALVTASSVITVLASSVLLIAISRFLAERVLEVPHLQQTLVPAILLLAGGTFRGIQNGTFAGLERFDIIAKLSMLDGVLALPAIVLFSHTLGVAGALLGLASSSAVAWILGRFTLVKVLPKHGIKVQYRGAWKDWRILSHYGLPRFLTSSFSTPVIWLAMVFVARSEGGYAALGVYNAAYQWVGPLIFIPMILSNVSIPTLVQEWTGHRPKRFRKVYVGILLLAAAVATGPAFIVALSSPLIMKLYGPGFQEGWLMLCVLAAAAPFLAIGNMSSNALFAINRPWYDFLVMLLWGGMLLTVVVSMLSTRGVFALVIAFLLSHLMRALVTFILVLGEARKREFSLSE